MGKKLRYKEIFAQARDEGLIGAEDSSVIFYDFDLLSDSLHQLKTSFPEHCLHTIAIKTNPLAKVLNAIGFEGLGHEAASAGEVILAAENSNGWIVYDGPAKTSHELEKILAYNDRLLINANSFYDLKKILAHPFENVGLRVNTHVSTGVDQRYDVSSYHSKFGVPISQREEIVNTYITFPRLNALHFHLGSGITSMTPYREALKLVKSLLTEIKEERNKANVETNIQYLDIGGGMLAEDKKGDHNRVSELGKLVRTEFEGLANQYTIITEFGQYIHTHNSWLYTEIADILDYDDHKTLILYQGANMFVRQAYTDQQPPFSYSIMTRPNAEPVNVYDLAGPLCFSGDYIAKEVPLPKVELGDQLVIDSIGANTYALWSQHCSFPFPKVIGYKEGKLFIIREREDINKIEHFS